MVPVALAETGVDESFDAVAVAVFVAFVVPAGTPLDATTALIVNFTDVPGFIVPIVKVIVEIVPTTLMSCAVATALLPGPPKVTEGADAYPLPRLVRRTPVT